MQQQLINKYLRKRGFTNQQIRMLATPAGKSQDVNFVLERYSAEANAQRNKHGSSALVVVIDADENTVQARKSQLDKALRDAGETERTEGEAIALVVPRRNVETWVWHLEGNAVDEETNYKNNPVRSGHSLSGVKLRFADYIITGQEPFPPAPPSLQDARAELKRVPHR